MNETNLPLSLRYFRDDGLPSANLVRLLPAATVQKIINEILTPDAGMSYGRDARDLLIECCVEFITLISSEANEIAEREAKKTIGHEHVIKALEDLGFGHYISEVVQAVNEFKEQQKTREKKQSKLEQSGLSEAELLRQQEELFGAAREKYNQGPAE